MCVLWPKLLTGYNVKSRYFQIWLVFCWHKIDRLSVYHSVVHRVRAENYGRTSEVPFIANFSIFLVIFSLATYLLNKVIACLFILMIINLPNFYGDLSICKFKSGKRSSPKAVVYFHVSCIPHTEFLDSLLWMAELSFSSAGF